MLFIEIDILEFTGGHIGIMLYLDLYIKISGRPSWNYAIYKDLNNRINRRPYWDFAIFRDRKF